MKKLFIIFACLMSLAAAGGTAYACHFENVTLTADCSGYTISGEVVADWVWHNGKSVSFEVTLLSNGEPITASGSYLIDVELVPGQPSYFSVPFSFAGSWGQVPCGNVTVSGTVSIPNYPAPTVAALGPLSFTCICETWCPRTPGYWKNHPEMWPATSVVLGGVTYTSQMLMDALTAPTLGDISVIFMKHLIAATFNTLSGSDVTAIGNIIDLSNACLATGTCTSGEIEGYKDILDQFNNSGECD